VPDENSTTLAVTARADVTHDGRRYPIRTAASTGGRLAAPPLCL
jgi:hypothetical protein